MAEVGDRRMVVALVTLPYIMVLMVTCSNIFKLRIRENQFKARENQNLLVYRSNRLLWKNSLPVVPIDIEEK